MKTIRKIVKWFIIVSLSLIVVMAACWWLIPDEPLHPDIGNLTATHHPPPAAENAYFLFWGINASPDLDPHAAGQKIVAEHERWIVANAHATGFEIDRYLGKNPLSLKPDAWQCIPEKHSCLMYYQELRRQVEAETAKHLLHLERYRSLRSYPRFSERVVSLTVTSPLPPYEAVSALSSLVDAGIALQVVSDATRKAALNELAQEIRLWRKLLGDSDALITQMIANATLHRKYALASEIMRGYPDTVNKYPATMAEITRPLSGQEANFLRALESEFRFATAVYHDLPRWAKNAAADASWLDSVINSAALAGLYKPMATINLSYSTFQKNARFYAQTPKEIVDRHAAHMKNLDDFDPLQPSVIFYNPVGKVLAGVGAHDLGVYSFRLHDLRARSRMLELQRRIAENNIRANKRRAFLANAGQDLMNPYTETPFEVDDAGKIISFAGHGGSYLKDGRVQVELAD